MHGVLMVIEPVHSRLPATVAWPKPSAPTELAQSAATVTFGLGDGVGDKKVIVEAVAGCRTAAPGAVGLVVDASVEDADAAERPPANETPAVAVDIPTASTPATTNRIRCRFISPP
jgi:hypothetical protein